MLQCDVTDINIELGELERRLETRRREFTELIPSAPCCALHMMELVAADRARHLHLTLLEHGLRNDYDLWVKQTMDQRMCEIGFRRVARHQPLYLRRTFAGVDLSDIFATIHIEIKDLDALMAAIRR